MHRRTEGRKENKYRKFKIRKLERQKQTGVGCVFSVRAAQTYHVYGRGCLMQRRLERAREAEIPGLARVYERKC